MSRNTVGMLVIGLCVATISYSHEASKDSSKEVQAVQGFWLGSYGGGHRDGVRSLPGIAELFIQGDHIEMCGYPDTVTGTFRLDLKAKRMQITRSDESGGKITAKTLDYGYEVKGDKLTVTDGGKRSIMFLKRDVVRDPLANASIDLVTAEGINKAGDLLVTEFTELQVGQVRAPYFEPRKRSLKTKQATVLVVQKTGCKKISLNEARGLIRASMPVVITYRQDDRRPPDQWLQLAKEIGPPAPDGEAVGRMFSRMLQPGTLVFVLSAKENVPMP
jgi:hypothetical protein